MEKPLKALVSIICFAKNGEEMIERSLRSLKAQTYPHWEYVIQDACSTDRTREIVESFADSRIKWRSEPDSGSSDGMLRALRRCRGEIIGCCLTDEELLPDALERAVNAFDRLPLVDAIYGDAYNVSPDGKVLAEIIGADFDFVGLCRRTYIPHYPSAFFRREAFQRIGLLDKNFFTHAAEFYIWFQLGLAGSTAYVPGFFSKYTIHPKQLSNTPRAAMVFQDAALPLLERAFAPGGALADCPPYFTLFAVSWCVAVGNHFSYMAGSANKKFARRLFREAGRYLLHREEFQPRAMGLRDPAGSTGGGSLSLRARAKRAAIQTIRIGLRALPENYRKPFKLENLRKWKLQLSRPIREFLFLFTPVAVSRRQGRAYVERLALWAQADFGLFFESRGQLERARICFEKAKPLRLKFLDSVFCQAMLKHPAFGPAELLAIQKDWAQCYAHSQLVKLPNRPLSTNRKIRVGYLCAFWNAGFVQHQVIPFVKRHDRSRFEIYGFSRFGEIGENEKCFDRFYDTGHLAGESFVRFARELDLDVVVEITGFSFGHRFAELSHRIAPVQVSIINHNGTTGTPNVDYVLADSIGAPPELDPFFTEKVYRLSRSFFCFHYENTGFPAPSPLPPCATKGYPTFGYFGSHGKIHDELLASWARILQRVPHSRLYVRNLELSSEDNQRLFRNRLGKFGITSDRILVAGGLPQAKLLREYENVDISLDTWPYNGGNTISESLWQGVPVVTLRRGTFSGSYGASLLTANGCADLVGHDFPSYEDLAVRLAGDKPRLEQLRRNLRSMGFQHGFRDVDAYVRCLEHAYEDMLQALEPMANQRRPRIGLSESGALAPSLSKYEGDFREL